jgi:hypothetical protein
MLGANAEHGAPNLRKLNVGDFEARCGDGISHALHQ